MHPLSEIIRADAPPVRPISGALPGIRPMGALFCKMCNSSSNVDQMGASARRRCTVRRDHHQGFVQTTDLCRVPDRDRHQWESSPVTPCGLVHRCPRMRVTPWLRPAALLETRREGCRSVAACCCKFAVREASREVSRTKGARVRATPAWQPCGRRRPPPHPPFARWLASRAPPAVLGGPEACGESVVSRRTRL